MSFHLRQRAHNLARHLDITVPQARELIEAGAIPEQHGDVPLRDDRAYVAAVERVRPHFDTSLQPFVEDLRRLVVDLRAGLAEDSSPNRRAVAFQFFGFGEHGENAYLIDCRYRAWHAHRVGVSHSQLEAAGYEQFARRWTSRPWDSISGEILLTPDLSDERRNDDRYAWLRPHRAEFLERLCDVMELSR
jgi:hypothetical protein